MSETGEALRVASDRLLRDLEVLAALEEEKRSLQPDDPRVPGLATRIREVAGRVLDTSVRQEQLTREVAASVSADSPDVPEAPIAETPRSASSILAEWRAAERRLSEAVPGSPEASEARLLVTGLRAEYRRAFDEASRD